MLCDFPFGPIAIDSKGTRRKGQRRIQGKNRLPKSTTIANQPTTQKKAPTNHSISSLVMSTTESGVHPAPTAAATDQPEAKRQKIEDAEMKQAEIDRPQQPATTTPAAGQKPVGEKEVVSMEDVGESGAGGQPPSAASPAARADTKRMREKSAGNKDKIQMNNTIPATHLLIPSGVPLLFLFRHTEYLQSQRILSQLQTLCPGYDPAEAEAFLSTTRTHTHAAAVDKSSRPRMRHLSFYRCGCYCVCLCCLCRQCMVVSLACCYASASPRLLSARLDGGR